MSDDAASAKAKGIEAFKAKDFEKSVVEFNNAIALAPSDHTLYGNLSASYYNLNKFDEALESAENCIKINPGWSKGYQRKGLALTALKKKKEAIDAYNEGLKVDPTNEQIKESLQLLEEEMNSEDNPFFNAETMTKLMMNEKTRGYLADPDFKMKFELCKKNPQMFMQMMQMDKRFMDVFQVITGIDLEMMQKNKEDTQKFSEQAKKEKEEREAKKKKEEEERKKKEEEEALPDDEKTKLANHKLADKEKDLGNTFYKNKDFENALTHYEKAIELFPEDLTYYTNKAAVFFEMKEYDKWIEQCDRAVEITKDGYYDYAKLSKAFARKANALSKLKRYDESIENYKKAMREHNDPAYKEAMKSVEKHKKVEEELAYLDPAKAEEHREAGNKLFSENQYPEAIKEYDEGLRRDPNNVKIYSNRAATYMKLMELPHALKDINKGLEIDPNFVKLWVRKGNIHFLMKEYHKALEAFDKGLKLEPDNKELAEGKQKVMMAITMSASGGGDGESDQERLAKAMADPEIQALLKDLRIQQLLKEMQENPVAAQAKLKDSFYVDAINKLVAAGVVKLR